MVPKATHSQNGPNPARRPQTQKGLEGPVHGRAGQIRQHPQQQVRKS